MSNPSTVEITRIENPSALIEKLAKDKGFVHIGLPPSESRKPDPTAGFSIVSAFPESTLQLRAGDSENKLEHLQRFLLKTLESRHTELPEGFRSLPFSGGFIGYAAYEFGFICDDAFQNFVKALPDQMLLIHAGYYGWALIHDHGSGNSWLVVHPDCNLQTRRKLKTLVSTQADTGPHTDPSDNVPFSLQSPFQPIESKASYLDKIRRVKDYIHAGDCYQVNLSQCFEAGYEGDPWEAYKSLAAVSPAPFAAYMDLQEQQIISLSPERFLKIQGDRLETKPIKGTRPRGQDKKTDQALRTALTESLKDRAENLMIVDLLRNDLGKNCRVGSVRVDKLFAVESFSNVHHLVSTITGRLQNGTPLFRVFTDAFPGGSITGAPKIRAMQIIEELESRPRGPYCGSVFYFSHHGSMDSSICIRTAQCENGVIRCWGGGGIVADSDPEAEYDETVTKVGQIMTTLEKLPR